MICNINYYYFKSAISKEDCEKIRHLGTSKLLETAVTRGNNEKSDNDKKAIGNKTFEKIRKEGDTIENYYIRDSKVSWLDEPWIYSLLQPFVTKANKEAGWNFEWDFSESCQFTKYTPGGFYSWHQDAAADNS